ncbi:MAG: hypothetical protein QNJ40_04640 [Xanthomonadales bacterium]|nr:hypothetical protein [Xanthomonadales bacterium]
MDWLARFHDWYGSAGVALVLLAYFLIQRGTIDVADWRYSAMNLLGAGLILASLAVEFNLSAFLVEFFWLVISVYGLVKALRRPQPEST